MKKFLLIILYFLPLTISAQTDDVMPSDTAYFPPGTWWIQVEKNTGGAMWDCVYQEVSEKKSQIGGKIYYQIWGKVCKIYNEKGAYGCGDLYTYGTYIREENSKVYVKRGGYSEFLTYDFSDEAWQIGNTFPNFYFPITQLGETTLLDGKTYKTWDYEGNGDYYILDRGAVGKLIQGIGHTGGYGITYWGENNGSLPWRSPGTQLYCFYRSGEKLYQDDICPFNLESLMNVGPQSGTEVPVSNISIDREENSTIYDLSGRKLTEKPQKGFYIQGGRKYIAR